MKISNVVYTNHALQRIKERNLSIDWAQKSIKNADSEREGKESGTTEFKKQFGDRTVTSICKKNSNGELIVLSIWVDPPFPGTQDAKKKAHYVNGLTKRKRYMSEMETAGFWKKLWLTFKYQAF